jgi:hypothetical protein
MKQTEVLPARYIEGIAAHDSVAPQILHGLDGGSAVGNVFI